MKNYLLILLVFTSQISAAEPEYWSLFESSKSTERIQAIHAALNDIMPKFDVPTNKDIPAPHPELRQKIKSLFLKLIDDKEESVQAAALESFAFGFPNNTAEIEEKAISRFTSTSDEMRRCCIMVLLLNDSKHPKVPSVIAAALTDKSEAVRGNAVGAATRYLSDDPNLPKKLTKILAEDDLNQKMSAIHALMDCTDLPSETIKAIIAVDPKDNEFLQAAKESALALIQRKLGPQRWQRGRLARRNPFGFGRVWIEGDKDFTGGLSCTVVISASGSIPTQYAPVPEGVKAKALPIDVIWFKDGHSVALIYKDQADMVLSWDPKLFRAALSKMNAEFLNPQQRQMTEDDYKSIKIESKTAYLKQLASDREKKTLEERIILDRKGDVVQIWHVYENMDGMPIMHGVYETRFENGKVSETGEYKDGIIDGRIKEWNEKGDLIADGLWKDGKPESGKCRDINDPTRLIRDFERGIPMK